VSKSLVDGLDDFYTAQAAEETQVEGNRPWSRPIKSIAMAVHPDQVQEAAEMDVKLGVPTEYTEDGRPILRDRDHRRRFMQAHGLFDRDAGFGDAAPQHHKGDRPPPSRLRELARKYADRIRLRHQGGE
jgi:hypothetical protein